MLMHGTKSGRYKKIISTMRTDNRGKSDISSLSTVSIFKAIKSDPRRVHSRAVVATTVDCTRDLYGASFRPYIHTAYWTRESNELQFARRNAARSLLRH